jgi:hypothetical protein
MQQEIYEKAGFDFRQSASRLLICPQNAASQPFHRRRVKANTTMTAIPRRRYFELPDQT